MGWMAANHLGSLACISGERVRDKPRMAVPAQLQADLAPRSRASGSRSAAVRPLGKAIFAVISGLWSHVREEKSLHPGIMAQSPSFSRCRWVPMCSMNLTRVHLGASNYRPCSFSPAGGHSDPPPICQFSSPSSLALGKWGSVCLSRGGSSESRAETGRSRGKDDIWKRGNTWTKYFHFAFLEAGCRNANKFHLRKSQSETVHAWLPVQVDRTSC